MFKVEAGRRQRLYRKIATMIGNGVQILSAIESLRDRRIAAGDKDEPETKALAEWATKLRNGSTFSQALAEWVTDEEAMILSAGEQSGEMEAAMLSAATVLDAKSKIFWTTVKKLAYPTILVLIGFAILYMFGFKIVPAFNKSVKDPSVWTGVARMVVMVSLWAKDWLWTVAVAGVAVVVAFVVSLPRWDGAARIWLDQKPPYDIYRMIQGSSWLIALAAMVEAGMKIESALQQLKGYASPWLEARIGAAIAGLKSGHNLGDSLQKSGYKFPDQEIIDDLAIYASLSGFDEALAILGKEWQTEAVAQIEMRMNVVFVIAMMFVGGLVAFMVGGMMDMQMQLATLTQQRMR